MDDATRQRRGEKPAPAATAAVARTRGETARGVLGRRRNKLLLIAFILIFVLLGADRLLALVAQRRLADQIQSAQHLSARPDVSIGGWPFLTQVFRGSYSTVTVSTPASATVDGVRITRPIVHLRDVRVGVSDMLHGTVRDVPVGSGTGTGVLRYSDLNAALRRFAPALGSAVTISAGQGGNARLTGPFGLSLTITAVVHNGSLLISPSASELAQLPAIIRGPIQAAVHQPIPLPPFPFNVHLTSAKFAADGVHLKASAHNSVFPVR